MDLKLENNYLRKYRVLWHILFWLSFWVYEGLVWGTLDNAYQVRFISSLIELPLKIIATYFTLYVLIDKFLLKSKYLKFFVYLALSMIVFGLSLRILAYYTIYYLFYPDAYSIPLFYFPKMAIATFSIYSIVGLVASFHLIKHSYRTLKERQVLEKTAQELEKGKLEAELKLLKSQINPHFLFNTLNNLYVLALNNSNRAPEVVYKLSQLMSYMLYESNQPNVPLGKEIQYIQNYIALEKIRYGDRLDVALNIFVEDTEGIEIPPLLLLPYIENCFKHGVGNQIDKVWVRIDILVQEQQLVLKVENSKGYFPEDLTQKKSGIGLFNARKRLDLIYKTRYNLQILNEEETFLVILKIQLNSEAFQESVMVPEEMDK
jgi:two-component system, LytTR family, sensor kinase